MYRADGVQCTCIICLSLHSGLIDIAVYMLIISRENWSRLGSVWLSSTGDNYIIEQVVRLSCSVLQYAAHSLKQNCDMRNN